MKHHASWILGVALWLAACNGDSYQTDAGPDGGHDAGEWVPPVVHVDVPFLQEVGEVIGELQDVRAVALDPDGVPFVATAQGVMRYDGAAWVAVTVLVADEIHDLAFVEQGLLAVAGAGGVAVGDHVVVLPAGAEARFVSKRSAGGVWIAGGNVAGYWDGDFHSIFDSIDQPVEAIGDLADGTWFAATPQGVFSASGVVTVADGLPSDRVQAVAFGPDQTVWVGTDAGLARRDPLTGVWTAFLGTQGLHYGDISDLGFDGDGVLRVATRMGASLYRPDGSRRYYFGRNWLPDDEVREVAREEDGTVWLATAGGVSRVGQQWITLAEKAEEFDRITQERHVRLGYTSTENHLLEYGDTAQFTNHDDDNDGQWTAMYLASQCFRFAVTGEAEARENARVATQALMKLEEVTPMEGFFARSIVPGSECEAKMEGPGEWHLSEDEQWCWKGDSSGDEFVGHMFGLSLYYDLVADEEEKREVAGTVGRMLGYIIDNGYQLIDVDGEPTTHGFFNPEWMEENPWAMFGDAGLYSAMILGGLHAAYHMTGEDRFAESFDYLARERNYADYVACIEEINTSFHTNHDSEEMSFLAMYTLLRYEQDPHLADRYRHGDPQRDCAGLSYLWEVQRPERNPEFNTIFAAVARRDEYDLDSSIETLQGLPPSLVLWGMDLSHRWDRDQDPANDRFGRAQNRFVFPYRERQAMRWAENPYAYELRGNGYSESSGTFWLLPYWMSRYHGFIE